MGATMKDIARVTGLGLATISSYLNGGNVREKNRIKIEAAIDELDFEVNEVARGLKTNRTKTIGIIIPEHLERFLHVGKPVVLIDRNLEDVPCDSVLVDNRGAAQAAVERLFLAGHRKIGMIAGPEHVFTARERYLGYEEAFKKAGIEVQDSLVVHGDYTIAGGARAMKELAKQNPQMTAVFVSNYEMTVGAMIESNEIGIRIPEDLSVIGFDNIEFAKASNPKLSIVTQPTKEIGRNVAELILDRLDNPTREMPPKEMKLKTSFVEGKSVHILSV